MTSYSDFGSDSGAFQRWLGFDFGQRRCGFAVSDPGAVLASPLAVLEYEPRASLNARLLAELRRRAIQPGEIVGLVCGLPLGVRGEETEMSAQVRAAAAAVQSALADAGSANPALEFMDERFSSREMLARGGDLGIRGKEARRNIDAWAATSILQGFLDSRRAQGL